MGRGGGVSSRGRGKFKISRGGGRHFSRDLDPRIAERNRLNNPEDESSEEDSDEASDDDGGAIPSRPGPVPATLSKEMAGLNLKLGNTEPVQQEDMSRAEKKAMKKAQVKKEIVEEDSDLDSDEDDELLNPQKATAKRQEEKATGKMAIKPVVAASKPVVTELSRKEREAADKKAAADRYAKLHAQGKTQEAKSDLARLQEIRRQREAAAAQRKAEADESVKQAAMKKEKAAGRKV